MTSTDRGAVEVDELLGRLIFYAGKNKERSAYSIKESLFNTMLSKFPTRFLQNQKILPSSDKGLGQVTPVIPVKVASLIHVYTLQEK